MDTKGNKFPNNLNMFSIYWYIYDNILALLNNIYLLNIKTKLLL